MKLFSVALIALLCLTGCEGITIDQGQAARPAQTTWPSVAPVAPVLSDPCPGGQCPREHRSGRYETIYKNAVPYVYIPLEMRERNYAGGSCVHASMETVFRIQHEYEWADWWRKQYAGGEYVSGLTSKLENAGWRFAYAEGGGESARRFLKDCCDLRLGCVIGIPSGHAQTLVGRDENYYYVVNNNGSGKVDHYTHQQFYRSWQGWGVTVVGKAPPPEPFR